MKKTMSYDKEELWRLSNNPVSGIPLPKGAYFDDDEMLRDSDGKLLPDGGYLTSDGVLMYEGNFEMSMMLMS